MVPSPRSNRRTARGSRGRARSSALVGLVGVGWVAGCGHPDPGRPAESPRPTTTTTTSPGQRSPLGPRATAAADPASTSPTPTHHRLLAGDWTPADLELAIDGATPDSEVGLALATGDLDGDGSAELLFSDNTASGAARAWDGPWTGDRVSSAARATLAADSEIYGIGSGDLNGDGVGDLVAMPAAVDDVAPVLAVVDGPAVADAPLSDLAFSQVTASWSARRALAADVDGDGLAEIWYGEAVSGDFTRQAIDVLEAPLPASTASPAGSYAGDGELARIDGDGDGIDEVVELGNPCGAGSALSVMDHVPVGAEASSVAVDGLDLDPPTCQATLANVGDATGDGLDDLGVSVVQELYSYCGPDPVADFAVVLEAPLTAGALAAPWARFDAGYGATALVPAAGADFDHDGLVELLVNADDASALVDARPGRYDAPAVAQWTLNRIPYAVATGDLDGDGWTDLALGEPFGAGIEVVFGAPP